MPANLYVLLFSLYWAQGLPVGFMTHALPVLLRMEGVSLAQIGGFGLLMLPWAIKALWAPWVDYFGHFRRWIIITQILSLMFLLCLAYLPIGDLQQSKQLWLFFLVLFLLNTAGATQDIATDGLAVKLLKQQQQHWGNMLQVVGSRLGFIVGGGALLWLMDDLHWKNSFLLLALLVLLNSLPILFARISQSEVTAKATFHFDMATCRAYLQYFSQHAELRMWLWVLLSFKLADGLFAPMSKTIMVDLGLSLKQIGLYISMLGAVCALIGSVIAGWALGYLKRDQALLGFSLLKLLSLCSMAWLAAQVHAQVTIQPWLIYVLHAVEECCSALLLVVMLTLIMQYCRTEYAGTDFTLQVSLMALVSGAGYVFGGAITQYLGYVGMMILVILIGFLNLLMINKWKSRFLTLKF